MRLKEIEFHKIRIFQCRPVDGLKGWYLCDIDITVGIKGEGFAFKADTLECLFKMNKDGIIDLTKFFVCKPISYLDIKEEYKQKEGEYFLPCYDITMSKYTKKTFAKEYKAKIQDTLNNLEYEPDHIIIYGDIFPKYVNKENFKKRHENNI